MNKALFILAISSSFLITSNVHSDEYYDDYYPANSEYSWESYSYTNPTADSAFADSYYQDSDNDQYYDYPKRSYKTAKHKVYQSYQEEEEQPYYDTGSYSKLPSQIASQGEDVIIVDPKVHAWGAYTSDGRLLKSGLASAGAKWCPDLGRPCRTKTGVFRISSLGSSDCKSSRYPLGEGGAPMPYCMYFNGNQGLHGSHELAEANISHGCVRMSVADAKWLRFNFSRVGTKVVIKSY